MRPREPLLGRRHARIWLALVGVIVTGLAGCAGQPAVAPAGAKTEAAPYEGVFTGEFVDGKPLYRLPTIEVVGTRSRSAPGT